MSNQTPTVGVLAFHGDFAEHLSILETLHVRAIEVRSLEDLELVTHLIIPGGESTVMARFLEETGVGEAIHEFVKAGDLAVYGTCAGAILVSNKVTGKNAPKPLGLLNITIERNAYGTQLDSFETDLIIKGITKKVPVAFIRAPVIFKAGKDVEVLALHKGHPVLVRSGRVLAGTFHPEIRGRTDIHHLFLSI